MFADSMKARLRGHHLICLNFFRGEGYSEDFIDNIYSILKKEEVEVVDGPDDVCSKCPHLENGKCASNEYTNEMILFQDKEALRLLEWKPGLVVDWKKINLKIPGILIDWKTKFCKQCGYREVCFSE